MIRTVTRQEEFEALLLPVLPRAYSAARYMTGNASDAEDLVQEASMLAWRAFDRFEPGTNFRAWLLRILTNLNYTRLRGVARKPPSMPIDDLPDLYLYKKMGMDVPGAPDVDPAEALLRKLDASEVRRAIEELPDEFRVVAALYFSDDLSYQEIAETVGCPVGTVRSRLHRGRKLLQVSLWRLAEECGLVESRHGEDDHPASTQGVPEPEPGNLPSAVFVGAAQSAEAPAEANEIRR